MSTDDTTNRTPLSARGWLIIGVITVGVGAAVLWINRATSAAPFTGAVVEVSEGDTLSVRHEGRQVVVRLDGIDAPELGQAFGQQAKEFLAKLAAGRDVQVQPKEREPGRIVARVSVEGRDLGQQLMASGFAWHFTRRGVDAEYATAENGARAKRLGLWSDPSPLTPWDYRATHSR